jgi:hypothetical protein
VIAFVRAHSACAQGVTKGALTMTHTTDKPEATMLLRPALVRTDASRLTGNSLAFAGVATLSVSAPCQGRADIGRMEKPCRARAMGGNR